MRFGIPLLMPLMPLAFVGAEDRAANAKPIAMQRFMPFSRGSVAQSYAPRGGFSLRGLSHWRFVGRRTPGLPGVLFFLVMLRAKEHPASAEAGFWDEALAIPEEGLR
jgi:hypothetical protein